MFYYAVLGVGLFTTRGDALAQGHSFDAIKRFTSINEAEAFLSSSVKQKNERYYGHSSYNPDASRVFIYCDGGMKNNGKSNAKGGYAVFMPQTDYYHEKELTFSLSAGTNNVAELMAITEALKLLLNTALTVDEDLEWVVCYDSEYAYSVITKKKRAKANLDLVRRGQKILAECKATGLTVRFHHVRAHTKSQDLHSIGNDIVDKLCG